MRTEQTERTQVLVVGAGPTGLVAALGLRLAGVEVRVVDRLHQPRTTSRALGLQARAMEALEALGVVDEVIALSRPLHGSLIFNGERLLGRQRWVPPRAPYPYTYVFGQNALEEVLRERLAGLGTEVEWGVEITGVEDTGSGVVVSAMEARPIGADWVIGADGPGSVVRRAAGITFDGRSTGEAWMLADLHLAGDPTEADAMSWMSEDGALMLMRLPHEARRWRLFADVTDLDRAGRLPAPSLASAQSLLDERVSGVPRIEVAESGWESVYRVQIRQASGYRTGRLFVAGDAAHVFPPFGGQGMNTGILDAMNLAWKLAAVVGAGASDRLLDTYAQERMAVGRQVIEEVERRAALYAVRGRARRFLRDLAFRFLLAAPSMQRRAALAVSQLDQSVAGVSPLADRDGRLPRPRPGERAPDVRIGGRRLFRLREPMLFTMVRFDEGPATETDTRASAAAPVQEVVASRADRDAFRDYRARPGERVLIRPDGVVACRGTEQVVRRWLEQVAA